MLDFDVGSERRNGLCVRRVAAPPTIRAVDGLLSAYNWRAVAGSESRGRCMMASIDAAAQLRESDFDEPAILIKITNVDSSVLRSRFGLYGRVRREWAVSLDRVRNIRLALGVHNGKVVGVYRVAGWFHTDEIMRPDGDIPPAEGRVEFVGSLASDDLCERYKDRLVTDLFHGHNPIRYVGGA